MIHETVRHKEMQKSGWFQKTNVHKDFGLCLPTRLPVSGLNIFKMICCSLVIQLYHAIENDQRIPGEEVGDVVC